MANLGGDGRGQVFQEGEFFAEGPFELGEVADDITADQKTVGVVGEQGDPGRIGFSLVIKNIAGGQRPGEHD